MPQSCKNTGYFVWFEVTANLSWFQSCLRKKENIEVGGSFSTILLLIHVMLLRNDDYVTNAINILYQWCETQKKKKHRMTFLIDEDLLK